MEHRLLGRTEAGRPIEVLTAHAVAPATTPRDAVVLLGAHPDEDTAWSGQVLIQRLATDPGPLAGLTVHVVLCADPDGAYLNRRRGGSSFATYFLPGGYHRPATGEQPSLQLPLPGADAPGRRKELAATHALRTLLDEVLERPDAPPLIIDLHRCLAGGMYAMSTERQGALHSRLARVARTVGLPLELGGEATGDRLGPSVGAGVFLAAPAADFTRSNVLGSPAHYAKTLNPASTSLLIEVPTFLVDPVACGAREMARWVRETDRAVRECRRQLGDISRSAVGRAYLDREDVLCAVADELDASVKRDGADAVSGPWPVFAALRTTAQLAGTALAVGVRRPQGEEAQALHARTVAWAQQATNARAVPQGQAAMAHLVAVAVAVAGEAGLGMVQPR